MTKTEKLFIELVKELFNAEDISQRSLVPYKLMHNCIKEKINIERRERDKEVRR